MAILGFAGFAFAQDAPSEPDAAVVAEYERHVERGTELFGAGDFGGARREFKAAHAIHAEPTLLFNIASTHRREGDAVAALAAYRRFLVDAPADHQHRALAERTVAELEVAELEAAEREAVDEPGEDEEFFFDEGFDDEPVPDDVDTDAFLSDDEGGVEDGAADTGDELAAAPAGSEILAPATAVDADTGASRPGRTLRIAGVATAAAGGVALAFGVVSARRAAAAEADLEGQPAGAWSPSLQAIYEDGKAEERRAIGFGVAGVAALAVGGTLYWLGHRQGEDARLAIVPGDGEAQLVWLGRF